MYAVFDIYTCRTDIPIVLNGTNLIESRVEVTHEFNRMIAITSQ